MIRAYFSSVGQEKNFGIGLELEQIPRLDDLVEFYGAGALSVRTVVWHMESSEHGDDPMLAPYVYVVLGPPRP